MADAYQVDSAGNYTPGSATGAYDPNAQVGGNVKTPGAQISAWYSAYLGRAPESQDIVDQWSNQSPDVALAGIRDSAEAQAYKAKNAQTQATTQAPATPALQTPQTPNFSYSAPAASQDPMFKNFAQALIKRGLSSPNVDPNVPNFKSSTDAYAADQTRASRDALSALAERGGSHMNMDAATLSAAERAGQNTAGFRAALVQKNIEGERQTIQQALAAAEAMGNTELSAQLRERDQELAAAGFNANTAQQGWQDQYQTIFG
jgi:DNA-binding LacI/PurR family transcriptional regulator